MICSTKPLLHYCMEEHFHYLRIHVCLVPIAAATFARRSLNAGTQVQTLSMSHT